jgi:hypothetical protein
MSKMIIEFDNCFNCIHSVVQTSLTYLIAKIVSVSHVIMIGVNFSLKNSSPLCISITNLPIVLPLEACG